MKIYFAIFFFIAFLVLATAQKKVPLSYKKKLKLSVEEPSDLAITLDKKFLIVSDNGYVAKVDSIGKIIEKSNFKGFDFEGICIVGDFFYVSDESPRQIHVFNLADLSYKKTIQLEYHGARNSGFESITYNTETEHFLLVSEKDPIWIKEYDKNFNLLSQYSFQEARDISAAQFYLNKLWLLSDEDMKLYRLNSSSMKVEKIFSINTILNPEGFYFDSSGKLCIISDDMQTIYFFDQINWNE